MVFWFFLFLVWWVYRKYRIKVSSKLSRSVVRFVTVPYLLFTSRSSGRLLAPFSPKIHTSAGGATPPPPFRKRSSAVRLPSFFSRVPNGGDCAGIRNSKKESSTFGNYITTILLISYMPREKVTKHSCILYNFIIHYSEFKIHHFFFIQHLRRVFFVPF